MQNETPAVKNVRHEKTVMTYGTFDMMHFGHIDFLRRAAALGDRLIVAVSTDLFNEECKHKKAYQPFRLRKLFVEQIKVVDEVTKEESWGQKASDVMKYGTNVIVFGDDWAGKFDYLKNYGVEVVYLPRTPSISSTAMRKAIEMELEKTKQKEDCK